MDNSLDISVVYTNWNVRDLMRESILSLYRNTKDVTFDIIVVDDASTDGSAEMIKNEFPEIKLIVNAQNEGFSKTNNKGAKSAQGKYLLLLNTDTLLIDNSIKVLFDFLEANPEVGVCGGWLKNPDLTSQVSYGWFPSFSQAIIDAFFLNDFFPYAKFLNRGVIPDGSVLEPIEVDYVTGADILIRRDIINQIGLLDEHFRAYCEETDFCYRVKHRLKKKIFFIPNAQIIHYGGISYSKVRKYQIQLMSSSYDKFLTKHHNKFYSFCTRVLYAWHHGVKMVSRFIKFLWASSERKEERWNYFLNAWYLVRYSLFPDEQFTGK
ncbi:MAG: glycosyltransferase [Ignavibacteriae bacterium]|nr:glycosyltransferase [Ignavibacteriota bacterium]